MSPIAPLTLIRPIYIIFRNAEIFRNYFFQIKKINVKDNS